MHVDRDTRQMWFAPSDVTTYLASRWVFAQDLAVARGELGLAVALAVGALGTILASRAGGKTWRRQHGGQRLALLAVALGAETLGAYVLSDVLRPSAKDAVTLLTNMGIEVVLASGDRNEAAYGVAEQAGISRVFAEVLPEEKGRIVRRLQAEGKKVAMVGEGFNDAPALSHPAAMGNVLPAMWSFMLAARARGLGTAWTTIHLMQEQKVADILGIPFGEVQQVCLTPLAYTMGTDFKPAERPAPDTILHWDTW